MNRTKYTSNDTKLFSYSGSKAQYKSHFDDLHKQVEIKKVGTYIEAFAGSLSSMFHNLEYVSADRIIINDINPRLINLYRQIKENCQDVLDVFLLLENTFQDSIPTRLKNKRQIEKEEREKYLGHLRDFYKSAQDFYNNSDFNSVENAGTLLFLLQHNFNGLYEESKKTGKFMTSFNWRTNNPIKTVSEKLMNLNDFFTQNDVIIENLDTDALIEKYHKSYDTLIYLDPPYIDSKIAYSAEQTTNYNSIEAHLKLIESCKVFDYVLYSNNKNEKIDKELTFKVNFIRTIGITKNYKSKAKDEVLGFIDNITVNLPSVKDLIKSSSSTTEELKENNTLIKAPRLLISKNPYPIDIYTDDSISNNIDSPQYKVA